LKKAVLLIAVIFSFAESAPAWDRFGHSVVAEIAQRHLNPSVRERVLHYTGGQSLASISFWLEEVDDTEPYRTEFEGYHSSICTADCKSPLYFRKQKRQCRDGVSALEFYTECLKHYKEMPDSLVYTYLKIVTHIMGDIHCPTNISFEDEIISFFIIEGGDIKLSSGLASHQYPLYANRLDNWSRKQINSSTKAWIQDWFEDAARDVRPTVRTIPENARSGVRTVQQTEDLNDMELRKAGYRLAKLLNTVFK